ncbi:MAG: RMD1 family protein [Clostridia bacterium]|nr:RMD1 family protein [Clostridia bacterium]
MDPILFKAVAVSRELNITAIASRFGVERKLSWEDTLVLTESRLSGVLLHPEGKAVYVYSFGTLVFLNCADTDIRDVIDYLKNYDRNLSEFRGLEYTDDYSLIEGGEISVTYDELIVPEMKEFYPEIVAVTLAKSTALERIEDEISRLFDDVEGFINQLKKGALYISDERLAKLSGRILSYRYSTISYIMLLDKPDIVWGNEEAQELYAQLEHLFELSDRYSKFTHKTETLLDMTEVFANLYHAKRGTRLELLVIILIAFELVLNLVERYWPV